MDNIFGRKNFIANVLWQKRSSPEARLVFEDASQELLAEVKDVVLDTLTLMIPEAQGDWSLVSARVRSALKKFINKRMERRPMILPIIMEI
jgi:ribonuclease J